MLANPRCAGAALLISMTSVILVSSTCFASAPFFTGLGDLPGGDFRSLAYAVSSDRRVVVGSSSTGNGSRPFRWEDGMMSQLGSLGGWRSSGATAVSADGSVVVGDTDYGSQAFRWQDDVLSVLSGLPASGNYATGVSADGSVVVGYNTSVWNQGFRWQNSTATPVGRLRGASYARAVSGNGSVIVGYDVSGEGIEAFRWENGQITGLGDLPGGQVVSAAWAVSADGSTIVGSSESQYFGTTYGTDAFRWTAQEGMVALDPTKYSVAYAVSGDGSVIVGEGGSDAFIWDRQHGMRALTGILVNDYGLDLTGWRLMDARGISADGLTIVGRGLNPQGNQEAYIAHLPEPATLVLLLLAGSALPFPGPRPSRS